MPEDVPERDQSLEQNMIAALIESRARYKDFVETSSDFAWETGPRGELIFLSPTGALDFTPGQLNYRPPAGTGTPPGTRPSVVPGHVRTRRRFWPVPCGPSWDH